MVVDTALNNQFVTGRDEAIITSVQPSFHGSKLHLDVNNMKTLKIPKVVKSSMIIEAKYVILYTLGRQCSLRPALLLHFHGTVLICQLLKGLFARTSVTMYSTVRLYMPAAV